MPKKIAVLMPNWVGDFVMALSVVERKAKQPESSVVLIVPEKLSGLGKLLSPLPQIEYKRGNRKDFLNSVSEIKKASFDAFYLFPHSFSSAWFAFRAGVPLRRGISSELRGFLLTDRLPGRLANRNEHFTKEYSSVLDVPYVSPEEWKGDLRIEADPKYSGAVVLCPGAAYGPAKQWPEFNVLVRLMHDSKIVILGDKRDKEVSSKIARHMLHKVTDLCGETTLEEVVSIIAGASVVVSNDSGLMHVAGYLGTPVVGIFGSTTPEWTRPLGAKVRIASVYEKCSPCFERACPEKHYSCLKKITAESVMELVSEIRR